MKPFGLVLYRAMTQLLSPLVPFWLHWRVRVGKEDGARLGERLGKASIGRPRGQLVWLHGASVGEADLALNLIEALARTHGETRFLLTTGTRTSADLVAARLGDNTRHQYLPLDIPSMVQQFLSHWHPDLGIFMESELWPNLILAAKDQGMKLALVNARMNVWTLRRWQNVPSSAAFLLGAFDWIGAADPQTRLGLLHLRAQACTLSGNLKLAAPAPPADASTLSRLRSIFGTRKVWLALSTHKGEDEILMAAHHHIQKQHPDAVLVLVPRHPERAGHIAGLGEHSGFSCTLHSGQEMSEHVPDLYIGDSIGEMGLWLRLGAPAFIGGSLLPSLRGHNPLQAAKLKVPLLCGPYRASFARLYDDLHRDKAMIEARNARDIAGTVLAIWRDSKRAQAMAQAAWALAKDNAREPMEITLNALNGLIEGQG